MRAKVVIKGAGVKEVRTRPKKRALKEINKVKREPLLLVGAFGGISTS